MSACYVLTRSDNGWLRCCCWPARLHFGRAAYVRSTVRVTPSFYGSGHRTCRSATKESGMGYASNRRYSSVEETTSEQGSRSLREVV